VAHGHGEGKGVEGIGRSYNGSIKVSYIDKPEDGAGARIPGVLSTLFRAMGF